MNIKRISIAGICIISLIAMLCGCQKDTDNKSNTTNTTNTQPKVEYTIGVCQEANNEYHQQILQGFMAGITDYFPENNAIVTTTGADESINTDMICSNYIQANSSLIFTIGENSLLSAHNQTTTIPIIGSGVMDYKRVLNIPDDADNKEWDKTTNMNITGVSSTPNMSDVLSMMIEVTPSLSSVGLLYCPNDPDSIYQNHILEKYLNQAGIPWKEYSFYSPEMSTAAAQELAQYACLECSVLYIPAESSLSEKQDTIRKVALELNTPVVGGDKYIGDRTLCSMYNDPFDQGYNAAKTAYDLLVKDKKPQSIPIIDCSSDSEQKLYVKDICDKMGYTFPKSFKERDEFLSTYKLGSKTTRVEKDN
ncbi:MAG TPA: hypothetical protein DCR12_08155 [Lachnospiraceae bacterium]|nr:hypothetical protein [Lachnospiraceae bacterium]